MFREMFTRSSIFFYKNGYIPLGDVMRTFFGVQDKRVMEVIEPSQNTEEERKKKKKKKKKKK